tara:strand:- start:4999 stop:6093 length:1095 start_codon:yes stop_codon:yes gene_type:complete
MNKYFFLFLFFFLFSCKKNYYLNNSVFENNYNTVELSNNKYILNDTLIVPKGKKLIIKNNTELHVDNKSGVIINNGDIVFGENIDSLNLSFYKDSSFPFFGVKLFSKLKKIDFNIINNNNLKINNAFFKNISINSNSGDFIINNSVLENCFLNVFKKNCVIKNSIINSNLNTFIIDSCINFTLNNCLVLNTNKLLKFEKNDNVNIINCFFLENHKTLLVSNNNLKFSLFNNIVVKNNTFIYSNSLNDLNYYLYIINNTFDNNNIILNINNSKNYNNSILSKNNIFFNNKILFELHNIDINNNYCISNNYKLKGYYNQLVDPLFMDVKNYNYSLKNNSPALSLGVNNINTGANINNIDIIKYLKY